MASPLSCDGPFSKPAEMPASHCTVRHSPEPCAIHVPRRPPARSHPPGKEKCFGVTAEGSASAQCACISASCLLGEGSSSDRRQAKFASSARRRHANRKRLQRSSQPALCSPDVSRGGCPARDTNLWAPHLRASTQHSQTATNSKNSSSYWRPRLAVRRVLGWGLVHQLPAGARACGRGQRRSAASAVLYAIERSRTPRR